MDAMITTAALAGLEKLINTALRYDPGTRNALGTLSGQVLAISLTAPSLTVYLTAREPGISLMGQWEGEVHTQLRGSLPALINLARSQRTSFADSGVEVIGNTALLIELQRLLNNLDIDWEEALSELLGDIAGHQGATIIRGGVNYLRERSTSIQRLVSEFLTEELKSSPSRNELDAFYQDVDELRLQAERLEAKVQHYLRKQKV